ncbi:MAG: hypothetical protein ACO25B_03330 [Chitinophagaceae bacterium]
MQLIRWSYSREEWQRFLKWKNREKGLFFSLLHRLRAAGTTRVPEVRIMADGIWINDRHQPFQNSNRFIRNIRVRETGTVHVLEISYEQANEITDIRVPIPKGKLREAFQVRERLLLENASVR